MWQFWKYRERKIGGLEPKNNTEKTEKEGWSTWRKKNTRGGEKT